MITILFMAQLGVCFQPAKMVVTAYCPCRFCCDEWADGITACGHKIKPGDKFVAAPASIPFYTMLSIPGYNSGNPVRVLDRGGDITGNRIDVVFFEKSPDPSMTDLEYSHQLALEFGRQTLNVYGLIQ